jgi:hypothetical protein
MKMSAGRCWPPIWPSRQRRDEEGRGKTRSQGTIGFPRRRGGSGLCRLFKTAQAEIAGAAPADPRQTNLVETFRELYPSEFSYGGNRCIILNADDDVPEAALRHCVALALTYHLGKRKPARSK